MSEWGQVEIRFFPNSVRGTAETHGARATHEVASWGPVETETYSDNDNHNHTEEYKLYLKLQ